MTGFVSTEPERCGNCEFWDNGTCTHHKKEKDQSDFCHAFRLRGNRPTCGECVWLHKPLRNKTCYNNYDRTETSDICDGLTRTRRYTRKQTFDLVQITEPNIRDYASGVAPSTVEVPVGEGIIITSPDSGEFGVMVIPIDRKHFKVQPVEITKKGALRKVKVDGIRNTGFAGEVYSVNANGEIDMAPGDFISMVLVTTKPKDAWRLVPEPDDREHPRMHVPEVELAGDLGQAINTIRSTILRGGTTTHVAVDRVVERFKRAKAWAEVEAEAFREKILKYFDEADQT